jgi:hypothetical protein
MSLKKIALWWSAKKPTVEAVEPLAVVEPPADVEVPKRTATELFRSDRCPKFTLTWHMANESMPNRGIRLDQVKAVLMREEGRRETVSEDGTPRYWIRRDLPEGRLSLLVDQSEWPPRPGLTTGIITGVWHRLRTLDYPRGVAARLATASSRKRIRTAGGKHAKVRVSAYHGQVLLRASTWEALSAMTVVADQIADEHFLWMVEDDHDRSRTAVTVYGNADGWTA